MCFTPHAAKLLAVTHNSPQQYFPHGLSIRIAGHTAPLHMLLTADCISTVTGKPDEPRGRCQGMHRS